ncbi:hypothetical protein CAPTEDRAFT_185474 [Capitella teleta]|uniref:Uncharacterized protein n=1 Tax=Capitella teleta TaxID=283909 RepID=R7VD63_CAPTE|nr:hypothetical protein CAPTEDRAFT_185474 [Capitella teleta]|eukprot:ELU16512.1 hypothetical protein CAPTEDRAFT_185474 [Capitella teleta]
MRGVDLSPAFFLIFAFIGFQISDAIQCYSCKASATNEVDANIRCLEQAYLEDCDDFYQYYNEVEDQKPEDVDYYNYDDEYYGYDDDVEGYGDIDEAVYQPRGRRRRQAEETTTAQDNDEYDYEKAKYEYDYNNMEEYEYPEDLKESLSPTSTPTNEDKPSNETTDIEKVDVVVDEELPKDPEHYCYSQTHKNKWESYTVEKGCKKISYCNERYANSPEWGLPWHFCCDRSRCNAKQVEDKPQRIFGMRCRRTDDCIQGHVSRPVCPNLFKSCPSISQAQLLW